MKYWVSVMAVALLPYCGKEGQQSTSRTRSLSLESADRFPECKHILEQSLFNSTSNSSSSNKQLLRELSLLQSDVQTAYQKYSAGFEKEGAGGSAEGELWYGLFGKGNGSYSQEKLSFDEFKKRHSSGRSRYAQELKDYGLQSFESNALSNIRDANTVNAWLKCVTKPIDTPTFNCVGYRDASNSLLLRVIYNGGKFAGAIPRIQLDFPDDSVVVRSNADRYLAHGEGRVYRVKENNRKAGFELAVNAMLPKNTGSFSCVAAFPAARSHVNVCKVQLVRMYARGIITEEDFHAYDGAGNEIVVPVPINDGRYQLLTCKQFKEMTHVQQ